jgi:hypothetical protein
MKISITKENLKSFSIVCLAIAVILYALAFYLK